MSWMQALTVGLSIGVPAAPRIQRETERARLTSTLCQLVDSCYFVLVLDASHLRNKQKGPRGLFRKGTRVPSWLGISKRLQEAGRCESERARGTVRPCALTCVVASYVLRTWVTKRAANTCLHGSSVDTAYRYRRGCFPGTCILDESRLG